MIFTFLLLKRLVSDAVTDLTPEIWSHFTTQLSMTYLLPARVTDIERSRSRQTRSPTYCQQFTTQLSMTYLLPARVTDIREKPK
ncbi:hypothetical protein J6590_067069 [Homalodisca vitripennis]|nr:hypothetical protein J6590_067069 [Homalodisca vitripennis]